MKRMQSNEIVEVLTPEIFERLLRQRMFDKGVITRELVKVNKRSVVQDKHNASSIIEDIDEEIDSKGGSRAKNNKTINTLEDKDRLKELLEKKKWSSWLPWILISSFTICSIAMSIIGYVLLTINFKQLSYAYTYSETSLRKTSEIFIVKSSIHSLILLSNKEYNTKVEDMFMLRQQLMNESYKDLRMYNEELQDSFFKLRSANDIKTIHERMVTEVHKSGDNYWVSNYTFNEMDIRMIAYIYKILKLKREEYNMTNDIIYTYMTNTEIDSAEYIDTILDLNDLFQYKVKSIKNYFNTVNLISFSISLLFSYMIVIMLLVIYLRIRRNKLYVMSFFSHISIKSLEEITQQCEEFILDLTLVDEEKKNTEGTIRDSLQNTTDRDTESLSNINQSQYINSYKNDRVRSSKVFKDTWFTSLLTITKFLLNGCIIAAFSLTFFLVYKFQFKSFITTGNFAISIIRIEVSAVVLLTLMRESVNKDIGVSTLSNEYYQLREALNESVNILKTLEDVMIHSFIRLKHLNNSMIKSSTLTKNWLLRVIVKR
jgi:hypothetical protein